LPPSWNLSYRRKKEGRKKAVDVPGDTPHILQETPHGPQGTPLEPQAGSHVPQD
jgi:hypothetical protein